MRNLFDQYNGPENRLTHALAVCLDEDRTLLGIWRELFRLAGLDYGRSRGLSWHMIRHE